jgi:membrane fusion protein (multidrug efflux system)
MQRLKKNKRVDHIKTEVRAQKGSVGKWIYLTILTVMLLWIADIFFGKYVYLQASGMVMRDIKTISLSYTALLSELNVSNGTQVGQGDLLAEVNSIEVIEQLSTLTIKITDIDAQISARKSRLELTNNTLGLAKKRADMLDKLRSDQELAIEGGLVGTQNMSELLQDEFDSKVKYREMRTEQGSLAKEIKQLQGSRSQLQHIYEEINKIYHDGKIIAPAAGIVDNLQTHAGDVLKSGEKLFDILHGALFVLAYIDPAALYNIEEGDEVAILVGSEVISGQVQKIYPLSTELPKEFQRTFRPLERSTMVRISFEEGLKPPPVFTTTKVVSSGSVIRAIKSLFN